MEEVTFKVVSVYLIMLSILWIIYSIFNSWGTVCFNMSNAYITITVYGIELIWNNIIIKFVKD